MRRTACLAAGLLFSGGVIAASAGCPDTTNTAILPITAVEVDISDLLTGANLNCGTGPGDVYKYAAIVDYDLAQTRPSVENCEPPAGGYAAGGVFDCFTPGVFGNLPLEDGGVLPDGGSVTYSVRIYLFDYDNFKRKSPAIQSAVLPNGKNSSPLVCQLPYTWATTCTAIEEDMIPVNASCGLVALYGDAGTLEASSDASDGSDAPATDGPAFEAGETGVETGTDANHDAPDGPLDAPPD